MKQYIKQLFCKHLWQEKEEEKKLLSVRTSLTLVLGKFYDVKYKNYAIECVCVKCNKLKYKTREYKFKND